MMQTTGFETEVEAALGQAGLTSRTARFEPGLANLFAQGEFQSALYKTVLELPWRLPFLAESNRRDIGSLPGKPSDTLNTLSRLAGFGTRRTLLGDPAKGWLDQTMAPDSLSKLLTDFKARGVVKSAIPDLTAVPAAVRQAATIVLRAQDQVLKYRKLAFARTDVDAIYNLYVKGVNDSDPEEFDRSLRMMRSVDLSYLVAGAHDLILAAQTAQAVLVTTPSSTRYDVDIDTVWGSIRLSGGTANTYPDKPTLLVIDTGGADTYLNVPANASPQNFASVTIDTNGLDTYLSDPALAGSTVAAWSKRNSGAGKAGPGGALCGYAVLIDAEGDDVYRSHRSGLGASKFGVACLLDRSGKDTYDAYADAQGFGQFGVGILEDLEGDDSYSGFSQVQGVGQTAGVGALIDRAGTDKYVANETTIDFPSAQSAQHNVSMSQGAGNGRRADYLDGHSLAGGVGLLYDQAGNDSYSCGVFGQGVGYWMGVGMLWDEDGNDRYLGQWYIQGAAAHFAVGYLEDNAGKDRYEAPMNMALGAGHDFSLGMLVERAGDDEYIGPNLSLGAGNANGIGAFFDLTGNDSYKSSGITLGRAAEAPKQSVRSRALCFGLFMDFAGGDTFPASVNYATNGSRTVNWADKAPTVAESQVGVFWDR